MVTIVMVVSIIGIGIALMIGYLIIAEVVSALPAPQTSYSNSCQGHSLSDATFCNTTSVACGPLTDNVSSSVTCNDIAFETSIGSTQTTVFAGFGLLAVGIIVLAAFALIQVFRA